MSRVLFAWELGGGFGHLSPFLAVARLLRRRGHEVLFAAKEVNVAQQLLGEDGFPHVQSPRSAGPRRLFRKPVSFADILDEFGFGDFEVLAGFIRDWKRLFDDYRPEVLVAEYAPAAQLAARLAGLPCVRIDTGFSCPPDVAPFPCFRPWLNPTEGELLDKENALLRNINALCVREGAATFSRLQQALAADVTLLATVPELDHYQGREHGRYLGPLFSTDDGVELPWPDREGPRLFVYVRPFPELTEVLEALDTNGASVIACIPGMGDELRTTYSSGRFQISTSRVKLAPLLRQMDLAVTHAGHGLTAALLLAGVPMLTIPRNIEQWLATCNLERIGAGRGVTPGKIAAGFTSALQGLLSDAAYREHAGTMAKKYADYDQGRVVERLANFLERLPQKIKSGRNDFSEEAETFGNITMNRTKS